MKPWKRLFLHGVTIIASISALAAPPAHDSSVRATEATVDPDQRKWERAGFGHPQIEHVDYGDLSSSGYPTPTHELRFTGVIFRGVGWTKNLVKARLEKLAKIYARCGIRVNVTLVESDPVGGEDARFAERWDNGVRKAAVAKALPSDQKPTMFFAGQVGSTTFHGGVEGISTFATSYPKSNMNQLDREFKPLLNTTWIDFQNVADDAHLNPHFTTEAHELGHLLIDGRDRGLSYDEWGHVSTPNLMGVTPDLLNGELTDGQCKTIRDSGPGVSSLGGGLRRSR